MTDWPAILKLSKAWIAATRKSDVLETAYQAIKDMTMAAPADMKQEIQRAYALRRAELWKAKK